MQKQVKLRSHFDPFIMLKHVGLSCWMAQELKTNDFPFF